MPIAVGAFNGMFSASSVNRCVLPSNGSLICWGMDTVYWDAANRRTYAQQIPAFVSAASDVSYVASSEHTTCVVIGTNRTAVCWGGFSSAVTTVPMTGFRSIVISFGTFCGVTDNGAGYCWDPLSGAFYALPASANANVASVSSGFAHACLLSDTGSLSCWGLENYNGGGDFGQAIVPAAAATGIVQLELGGRHTCALSNSGSVLCWGAGSPQNPSCWGYCFGQATPPSSTQGGAVMISVRGHSSCAILLSGAIVCWGESQHGNLNVPSNVGSAYGIASYDTTTCAVYTSLSSSELTASCWGGGQLNNGNPYLAPSMLALPKARPVAQYGAQYVSLLVIPSHSTSTTATASPSPTPTQTLFSTGSIHTVAGAGSSLADGIPATAALLGTSWDSAIHPTTGDIYIAETSNHRIRRISMSSGLINTVAGSMQEGFSGDGGPATLASLRSPSAVSFDQTGQTLFILDFGNCVVRSVALATGIISTLLGVPEKGTFNGDGDATGKAVYPFGFYVHGSDAIYLADGNNARVRIFNPVTNTLSTVVGSGVRGASPDDGLQATQVSACGPSGVTISPGGNIVYSDSGSHRIRMVDRLTGVVSTIAGQGYLQG